MSLLCECCAYEVSPENYHVLASNPRYEDDDVFIIHASHKDCLGDEILETIAICGDLKLVKVAES